MNNKTYVLQMAIDRLKEEVETIDKEIAYHLDLGRKGQKAAELGKNVMHGIEKAMAIVGGLKQEIEQGTLDFNIPENIRVKCGNCGSNYVCSYNEDNISKCPVCAGGVKGEPKQ